MRYRCAWPALLLLASGVAGCGANPPKLPYLTIGEQDGRCGYDWNGAAVDLSRLADRAAAWPARDVLMVFKFAPVSERCMTAARAVFKGLGFTRIYIVSMPRPRPNDPPLLP